MIDETTVLYTSEQITIRVKELAQQLSVDYKDKKPILIGVLKGSFIFLSDLLRELYKSGLSDIDVDFMTVSSYGSGTTYSGTSTILHDLTKDITDRDVLVVEDIIDTGHTLSFIHDYLLKKNPASLRTIAFLDKKEKREASFDADYVGFVIEGKHWIEGYGLDGGEYGRGRPEVAVKEKRD